MRTTLLAILLRAALALSAAVIALPAAAHHPMGGAAPATFWQGLLSGVGHPVIEADHLVFLLGAAIAVAWARVPLRQALLALPAYTLAGAVGTALRVPGLELAGAELAVAITLLAVAAALWLRRVPGAPALAAIAAAGGLVHGYAYGEAVIGAETTPLLAYLTGLALTQTAMLAAAWFAARQVPAPLSAISERLSRAIGLLVGAFALWSGAALFA